MKSFLAGVCITLILVWFFVKYFTNNFKSVLDKALVIHKDLEQLCSQCLEVSDKIVNDLEEKINEGKELLLKYEKLDTPKLSLHTKNQSRNRKPKEKENEIKLTCKQKSILQLADAGWNVKEISQSLDVGQDQVAMVLQLYKK